MNIKKIEDFYTSHNFKIWDIQGIERSVGIYDGWVIIEDENGLLLEASYTDAEYHVFKNSEKEVFLKSFWKFIK